MIRLPPRSTRTDTLFPYTTLFRSEWTNVTRAGPLFDGHEQPRLPADLGFYDLRVPETRDAQAELARRYGITAFCYYFYWFAGRRFLHRPLDEVLASRRPDVPFCLRSEAPTSESQSLLRIQYAVFSLNKTKTRITSIQQCKCTPYTR